MTTDSDVRPTDFLAYLTGLANAGVDVEGLIAAARVFQSGDLTAPPAEGR